MIDLDVLDATEYQVKSIKPVSINFSVCKL